MRLVSLSSSQCVWQLMAAHAAVRLAVLDAVQEQLLEGPAPPVEQHKAQGMMRETRGGGRTALRCAVVRCGAMLCS